MMSIDNGDDGDDGRGFCRWLVMIAEDYVCMVVDVGVRKRNIFRKRKKKRRINTHPGLR